jgi:mobilization protein NikA
MASDNEKPQETLVPSASTVSGNETSRARSIATRLTDTEFGEVEAAAANAGKKVAEWLREAALAHARAGQEETDPILLAEIMGMRSLMLNLFARASEGPLTTEDLRKMSAYSDSIKEQRAQDYMAQRRRRTSPKTTDKP